MQEVYIDLERKSKDERYFIPDIEDIRVGYECEDMIGGKWSKIVMDKDKVLSHILWKELNVEEFLRTPYLTKEQIEAEGWKFEEYGINSGLPWFSKDVTYIDGIKRNIELRYDFNSKILELSYDCGEFMNMGIFHGECKCINTLRYICKLLKI